MVEIETARKFFPELDFLPIQELIVHQLFSLRRLNLDVNLVFALFY